MSTYTTVNDYYEVHGSVQESENQDGASASVTLIGPWASRGLVVRDVIGNRRAYPQFTGNGAPRATSVSVKPLPGTYTQSGQCMVYEFALVTINYSSDTEEDLISESLEPTAEFLTLDYRRFRWDDKDGDPLKEAEAPGRLLRGLNLVRTLYKVPSPLPTDIVDLTGSVNDTSYFSALLGIQFEEETLLYQPPSLNRTITTDGDKGWDITLKFSYKPSGWNKFWRAKSQEYEEIFDMESEEAYKNYPPMSYSALLF